MIKSNFPIDETFLSSVIYEGILLLGKNNDNIAVAKKDVLTKIEGYQNDRKFQIEEFKIDNLDSSKFPYKYFLVKIKNKEFKIKKNLKGRFPKYLILLPKTNEEIKLNKFKKELEKVSFIILDKEFYNSLDKTLQDMIRDKNHIILNINHDQKQYLQQRGSIRAFIITKQNGLYYLIIGNSVLRLDIFSTGKNDQNFFIKICDIYKTTVFNNDVYKSPTSILTFFKGFLESFNSAINISKIIINSQIKKIRKRNRYIDAFVISSDEVTGLQIFGCDRFTSFTSLETEYTTSQITIYTSPEVALVLLFGLASSFVTSADNNYYFLFFSPEEVSKLYLEQKKEQIENYFRIKDKAIEILREVYSRTSFNEIALMEITLNLELQELMNMYNLDKISFVLFKIALEGGQTYKIYEQIPIKLYRKIAFRDLIEKHFKNPDELIRRLVKIFKNKNESPYYVIWRALSSFNRQKSDEADNVLKAMQGLYRFVILGDLQGYYQFTREIMNCYEKTKNERKTDSERYLQILRSLEVY